MIGGPFICLSLLVIRYLYSLSLFPREVCEKALEEKHFLDGSQPEEGFLDEAAASLTRQIKALKEVFRKAAESDMPTEVTIAIFARLFMFDYLIIKNVPPRL